MPIPVQQFQPLSFEQANPILAGMQSANTIYQGLLQNQNQRMQNKFQPDMLQQKLQEMQLNNQILQPQAQYAPQMTQAELAYKQAMAPHLNAQTGLINQQSKYYGPEAEASINQMQASGELTRTQADFLRQTLPYKIQQERQSTFTDPILHRLAELQYAQGGAINPELLKQIGVGVEPQSQPQQSPDNSLGNNPLSNALQQSLNSTGLQPTPITAPKAFTGAPLSNWALTGSPYSPLQQMQMKAQEAGMTEQSKTDVKNYSKLQEDASAAADQAVDVKRDVEKFNDAFKRLSSFVYGPIVGKSPAVTGAARDADAASTSMLASFARLHQQGHITDNDFEIFKSLKLNRQMTPDSVRNLSIFTNLMADRLQEKAEFLNMASKVGLNPRESQVLWTRYDNDRPVFDYKEHKPLENNINSWPSYITPEKVMEVRSGKRDTTNYEEKFPKKGNEIKLPKKGNSIDLNAAYQKYGKDNLEHTAKLHNTTVEDVVSQLEGK